MLGGERARAADTLVLTDGMKTGVLAGCASDACMSDGSRGEPAIAFSGSLELGFEHGGAGVNCTPGSGSFKVYPRAFTQSAVAYVLAGGPR
ncbi:MAG: hypothetical protein ACREDZ_01535 [Kiloniellales bacterium]